KLARRPEAAVTAAVQPRAESEDLDAVLSRIEGIRIAPTPISGAAVSYGFFGDVLKDPRGRMAELLDSLWRKITHYSDIETAQARTQIGWTGDFSTAVTRDATHENLQEHARAV